MCVSISANRASDWANIVGHRTLRPSLRGRTQRKKRVLTRNRKTALMNSKVQEGVNLMQLYIVRHGVAIDREDPKSRRPDRYLTEEGSSAQASRQRHRSSGRHRRPADQ